MVSRTPASPARAPTRKVLAPVLVDHDQAWVAEFLGRLHQTAPILVHVLSVQPRYNGHVRAYVSARLIQEAQQEDAKRQIAPLCQALCRCGIPHHINVLEGPTAEQIARYAQVQRCEHIVIGPHTNPWSAQRILGSISHQVAQLMSLAGRPCEVI
jgi:nucleotide-binding universal stress UspA family protein